LINEKQSEYKYNKSRKFSELLKISKSFRLDLDFISDWMTISSCYAL